MFNELWQLLQDSVSHLGCFHNCFTNCLILFVYQKQTSGCVFSGKPNPEVVLIRRKLLLTYIVFSATNYGSNFRNQTNKQTKS